MTRHLRTLLFAIAGVALMCATAAARPGGGHTSSGGGGYSGGGYSGGGYSGGGYSGGGSAADGWVMIVIALIFVVLWLLSLALNQGQSRASWSTGVMADAPPPPVRPLDLAPLLGHDPKFSRAVFEDFVFELYAAAHRSRDNPASLYALQAYLSPAAIQQLAALGGASRQVVVGSLRISSVGMVAGEPPTDSVEVQIEATHHLATGPRHVVDKWWFTRLHGVVSRPPIHNRTWPCPNCGAPWTANQTWTCGHCNQPMGAGRFDWVLGWTMVVSAKPALASLTGTVPEYGNELATVRAPGVDAALASVLADDAALSHEAIAARYRLVYARLNQAWNDRDLRKVRGLVTASLRGYLQYWLDEYARQGLANRIDNARIERMELAKVLRDAQYDAVTMRVFANGNDYTLDARGHVVGGSRTANRRYTEYWTLIRSSARRGPIATEPTCPNCGAPLEDVSDRGDCGHCGATVELGSFDWVLSKIEQDDDYVG